MAAGYKDWAAGNVLTAADLEDYTVAQSVMRFADSSARDTALSAVKTEGMCAYLIDVNTLTVYTGSAWSTVGPVHGTGTAWTPAVVQSGSVTSTNTGSYYWRSGRLVTASFIVSTTAAGTGGNVITVSLPVTAAFTGSHSLAIGIGRAQDASPATVYRCIIELNSATTLQFIDVGTDTRVGDSLGLTLASGDTLSGTVTYLASADA